MEINSLNMLKFSHSRSGELPFSVYWVSASDGEYVDNLNFRNHHHAFYELHCLINGTMDYGVDGKTVRLNEGECMLIPAGCVHNVECCTERFIKLTVAFDLREPADHFGKCQPHKMTTSMLRDIDTLFSEAGTKSPHRSELVELSAISLVLRAADILGVVATTRTQEAGDDRVLKAKLLMEDNPNIFFTCEELSGYCRVSVKQLGRLFKEYEGKGLLEYIHFQKVETAKRMLAEQDLSQKKMAEMLGFSDYRYFGRFFMRMTGMTPGEFKREITKNDN